MNNRCVQVISLLIVSYFGFSIYGMDDGQNVFYRTIAGAAPFFFRSSFKSVVETMGSQGLSNTANDMPPLEPIESSSNVQQVAGVVASMVLPAVTTLVIRSAGNVVSRYTFKRPAITVNSHNGELEIEIVEKSEAEQKN